MRRGHVGVDFADRALLRRRQRVGERRDHALAQSALGGAAMSGPLPHMQSQQRKRELAGEQFVVSQPRPCRACRIERLRFLGAMDGAQRAGEIRIAVAREPRRVLPLRQLWDALERGIDRFAHLVRVQPFGQRIGPAASGLRLVSAAMTDDRRSGQRRTAAPSPRLAPRRTQPNLIVGPLCQRPIEKLDQALSLDDFDRLIDADSDLFLGHGEAMSERLRHHHAFRSYKTSHARAKEERVTAATRNPGITGGG